MEGRRARERPFRAWRRARLGGAVVALAAAALLHAAPASAQRARTLPRAGGGLAHPHDGWGAGAALALAAGAGATLAARKQRRGRAA